MNPKEHLPPHIHADSDDGDAMIDIRTGKLIKGEIDSKKLRFIQEWLSCADNRIMVEEEFYKLNPSLRAGNRLNSDQQKDKKDED